MVHYCRVALIYLCLTDAFYVILEWIYFPYLQNGMKVFMKLIIVDSAFSVLYSVAEWNECRYWC